MCFYNSVKLRTQFWVKILIEKSRQISTATKNENHSILTRLAVYALGKAGEATVVPKVVSNGPYLQIPLGFLD